MKKVLSVVLALAMVFAMSIMVSAATPKCDVSYAKNADGTITVKLVGTGENLATFDYGVAYDNTAFEVVPYVDAESGDESAVQWSSRMSSCAMKTANDQGDYVVVGGTHSSDSFTVKAGVEIATIVFKVKDAAKAETASFAVVADSAALIDAGKTGADFAAATDAAVKAVADIADPATPTPDAPASEEAPASQAPASEEAPASQTPATTAPVAPTKAPKTADNGIIVPVIAMVAAAAAVVVVSKKRIEE